MKKLKVINYSTCIKESNTQGSIPFIAIEDGNFVNLKDNETAQLAIKNDSGLIKKVDVECDSNNIFNLPTNTISNLPPNKYYAELWIKHEDDTVSIFPDDDFTEFEITENAEAIVGETIPVESVTSIKNDVIKALNGKVNVAIKIGEVKTGEPANVTNEVINGENVLSFTIPQGPQGEPGKDGISPTIKIAKVVSLPHGTDSYVKNVGNDNNIELEIGLESGADGAIGKNGISPTININKVINLPNGTPSYVKNIGTDSNVQLEIGLESPKEPINGINGKDGISPIVKIGKVNTVDSSQNASITDDVQGNINTFNFNIPKGIPGKTGENGQSATIKVGRVTESDNITTPEITNSGDSLNAIFNFVFPKINNNTSSNASSGTSDIFSNIQKIDISNTKFDANKCIKDATYLVKTPYFDSSTFQMVVPLNIPYVADYNYFIFINKVLSDINCVLQIILSSSNSVICARVANFNTDKTAVSGNWIINQGGGYSTVTTCPGFQNTNTQSNLQSGTYNIPAGNARLYCYYVFLKCLKDVPANTHVPLITCNTCNVGDTLRVLNTNSHETMFADVETNNYQNYFYITTKKGFKANDIITITGSNIEM